jgi:hypothetical protein
MLLPHHNLSDQHSSHPPKQVAKKTKKRFMVASLLTSANLVLVRDDDNDADLRTGWDDNGAEDDLLLLEYPLVVERVSGVRRRRRN